MNIFKRGMLYLRRNPAKTAVMALLVFVLGCVTAAAVSIYNAVVVTENAVYGRSATVATVDYDSDKVHEAVKNHVLSIEEVNGSDFYTTTFISADALESIGSLPQVDFYDYFTKTYIGGIYETESGKPLAALQLDERYYSKDSPWELDTMTNTTLSEPLEFQLGILKLIDGRFFNESELSGASHGILISRALAELNGLSLGSRVSIPSEIGYGDDIKETITFEAEVVGIFDIGIEFERDNWYAGQLSREEIENQPFSTMGFANEVSEKLIEAYRRCFPDENIDSLRQYQSYFVLKSPKDVESFRAEAEQYLPHYTKITATSDFYSPLAAPLETMKSLSSTVLYVSVGAVILILGLVIMLFLRSRRGEFGILLALGERRGRILGQVFVETISVSLCAMLAALLVGNAFSAQISERLVREQVTAQAEEIDQGAYSNTGENLTSNLYEMGIARLVSGDFIVDNYDVSMNARTALAFFGIGIAAAALASAVSMTYIVTLNPKKILLEVQQ